MARVRHWVVATAVVGTPTIFLRAVNDPFNVPKLALLLATCALGWAIYVLEIAHRWQHPPERKLLLLCAVMLAPLIVATVLSPYRSWTLFGEYGRFQGLIPYALVISLAPLVWVTFSGRLIELARLVTLSAAVAGGYLVVQRLGLDPFSWSTGDRGLTSTLGNTNFAAGFLAMSLPLVLWRLLSAGSDPRALLPAVLVVAGLFLCQSEGGYLAALAGAAIVGGFRFRTRLRLSPVLGLGVAGACGLAAAGSVLWNMTRPASDPFGNTVQLRAWWWQEAWATGLSSPLFGSGPNTFAVEWWGHRSLREASARAFDVPNDPHSVYLSLFVAAGALGAVALLWVLVTALRTGLRHLDDSDRGGAIAFAGAIAAYIVQATVSIDELGLRVMLWTSIGGVLAAVSPAPIAVVVRPRGKSRPRRSTMDIRVAIPATVLGMAGLLYGGVVLAADSKIRTARTQLMQGDLQGALDSFDEAISLRPDYEYRHIKGFLIADAAARLNDQGRLIDEAREAFTFADTFPDSAVLRDKGRSFAGYASAHADPEALALAADAYERAMGIDPYNPTLLSEGTEVLLDAERYRAIVRLVSPIVDQLEEHSSSLWPTLGIALHFTGADGAEDALDRARLQAPDHARTAELEELLGDS